MNHQYLNADGFLFKKKFKYITTFLNSFRYRSINKLNKNMEILKELEGKIIKSIVFDTPQLSGDINQMHESIKIICSDNSIYEIETSLNDFVGLIVEKKR